MKCTSFDLISYKYCLFLCRNVCDYAIHNHIRKHHHHLVLEDDEISKAEIKNLKEAYDTLSEADN